MKIAVAALCALDLLAILAACLFHAWPLSPALLLGTLAGLHLLLLPLLWRHKMPAQEAASEQEIAWSLALGEFDARGRIVQCNAEFQALFALGNHDFTLTQMLPPDDRDALNVLFDRMARSRAQVRVEERRFFRADGTCFQGRWHLQPHENQMRCWVEDISPLHEAQQAAHLARAALVELGAVVVGSGEAGSGDFEARIGALLELGRRRFDVETGFIGQCADNRLRVLDVRSNDGRIRRGQSYDLKEARIVDNLVRPLGPRGLVHGAFAASRAVIVRHEEETILCAPIMVGDEVWASLNFSDAEGRAPLHADDEQFLLLMTGWLGGELERRQARAQLEQQQLELLKAATELERLAVHDGLTDLKNRRAFDEQLAMEFQRARRYKMPLSLILLDVDKFKTFNDTFGHPAGDEVLKIIGQILGDGVRNIDFAARYGGEEFALILPNTEEIGAQILAERLRQKIAAHDWRMRAVTSSFGVATLNSPLQEATQLLKCADEALYAAKESGRNCVTHYDTLQVLAVATPLH